MSIHIHHHKTKQDTTGRLLDMCCLWYLFTDPRRTVGLADLVTTTPPLLSLSRSAVWCSCCSFAGTFPTRLSPVDHQSLVVLSWQPVWLLLSGQRCRHNPCMPSSYVVCHRTVVRCLWHVVHVVCLLSILPVCLLLLLSVLLLLLTLLLLLLSLLSWKRKKKWVSPRAIDQNQCSQYEGANQAPRSQNRKSC